MQLWLRTADLKPCLPLKCLISCLGTTNILVANLNSIFFLSLTFLPPGISSSLCPKLATQFHVHACSVTQSCLFVTSWTAAHQAPLSTEFPKEEYWSGLPFSSPGDLPNPGIKPESPASPAQAGRFFFFLFLPLSHLGSSLSFIVYQNPTHSNSSRISLFKHLTHSLPGPFNSGTLPSPAFLLLS